MRHIFPVAALILSGSLSSLAAIDNGLLALVPPNANVVGGVDASQARNSEFGQFILSKTQSDANFEKFVQQTGFDPRQDLQNFIFETTGPNGNQPPSSFAILARGTFDPAQIEAAAKANGAVVQSFQGVDLILGQKGNQQNAVAFLDNSLAIMGDVASLEQIIANRGAPTVLDPDFQQQILTLGSANDAWFVSRVPGSSFLGTHLGQNIKQPQGAQALQSILGSSGGIRFGDTVDVAFDAVTRSSQDAASLTDVVRFVASMVQMQRNKDPKAGILASTLDNMNLTTNGASVHLALSFPEKNLEQLAELKPRAAHRRFQQ